MNKASPTNDGSSPSVVPRNGQRGTSAGRALGELFAAADIRLDGGRPWDIRVLHEDFARRVLAGGTLAFGESYMDGWWECEALDEMVYRALRGRLTERIRPNLRHWASMAHSWVWNLQNKKRSRQVAEQHYDLGNEFFRTMLDPAMQYSCGYYAGTEDLIEAQQRKLELICRKLELEPGMRLLDIGCGWGGLARYAAEHHGCDVVGITISQEQAAFARDFCQGLPVEIRLQDYRDVAESFDRMVSVGMLEHVGHKNFRTYMETAARCLRADGLFLCHTIAGPVSTTHSDPWITKYIFPNSMLPSAAQVCRAVEGLFVVEDVHNFGAYYDPTLMAWETNFRAAWPQFAAQFGERFYRMWRFYLLSCAATFRARQIELYQFVLSPTGRPGGYARPNLLRLG